VKKARAGDTRAGSIPSTGKRVATPRQTQIGDPMNMPSAPSRVYPPNAHTRSQPQIALTLLCANQPISKRLDLDQNGKLVTLSEHTHLSVGIYQTVNLNSIEEHAARLAATRRQTHLALMYGVCTQGQVGPVSTLGLIAEGKAPTRAVARCKDHFAWWVGAPGIFFGDLESSSEAHRWWSAQDYDAAILQACPWLAGVRRFYVPSGSSHLHDMRHTSPQRVSTSNRWRLYFVVEDASLIPAVGNALWRGLVEAGFGYVKWMATGRPTVATISDRAVHQSERVDYAFGHTLPQHVVQLGNDPVWFGSEPMLGDATARRHCNAWADLSKYLKTTKPRALLASVAAEEKQRRVAYKEIKITEQMARGHSREQAGKICERIGASGNGGIDEWLIPEHVVEAGRNGTVSVGDMLRNPDAWNRVELCDPLEPDYAACGIAKAFLKDQHTCPVIRSLAHEGITYGLLMPVDMMFGPRKGPGGSGQHIASPRPAAQRVAAPYAAPRDGAAAPWDLYRQAKEEAQATGVVASTQFDVRPLIRMLALATDDPIVTKTELDQLAVWVAVSQDAV
jgi:hypothetical protein